MRPTVPSNTDVLQKTLATWLALMDKMTHFFINKLATLKKKHVFLHKVMPSLLKGYHLAIEHKLMAPEISQPLLDNIDSITNLEEEFAPALQVVDLVTSFCSQLSQDNTQSSLSMRTCVTEVLRNYEFKDHQRECVQFDEHHDFACVVPEFFIKTTLTTLLRFIFDNFQALTEKSLVISMRDHKDGHALHYKITAKETKENYDHWFQNSLNVASKPVSSGIYLCRLGLLYHQGDITYHAIPGESLEIIVSIAT